MYAEQILEDTDIKDWNDASTSQGMTAAIRNWKRQGKDSPLDSPERACPLPHWFQPSDTDFRLVASETMKEYISVLESHLVCGILLQWP